MSSLGEEPPQEDVDTLMSELEALENQQNESSFYEEENTSSTRVRHNSDTEIIPLDNMKPVFPTAVKLLSVEPDMKAVSYFNSYAYICGV